MSGLTDVGFDFLDRATGDQNIGEEESELIAGLVGGLPLAGELDRLIELYATEHLQAGFVAGLRLGVKLAGNPLALLVVEG